MQRDEIIIEILRKHNKQMTGLDIVKASDGRIGRGVVYTILSNMEDEGFVRRTIKYEPSPYPSKGNIKRHYFERRV